jgi:hypothetical protein
LNVEVSPIFTPNPLPDPYDVGVTILYAEGAINERLASFDWELVDVQ